MSDKMETIRARHSVRQYLQKQIPEGIRKELDDYTAELNRQSSLHIQILYDEPECFNSRMAHYGRFENCSNYIAMIGKKAPDLEEKCGYYGELLVLKAQELGLNTCWVALTHGKSKAAAAEGETEVIIISLGYGKTQGSTRKSKSPADVSNASSDSPEWFKKGIEAALLAPTAVNQQKFRFTRTDNKVSVKPGLIGSCLKIDIGIVKCHFEIGAGRENFEWI
ncbi:MAG: nitroreductase [Blautia sp.]|nr:nitroreductase [Blautia sp.]